MNRIFFTLLVPALLAAFPQATIVDSGSTNIAGIQISIPASGNSVRIKHRDGTLRHVTLSKEVCARFNRNLEAAGPLNALPARHCMKSASFGSALYVEFNGLRSPDLSCPSQADPRTAALSKDAAEILAFARAH